MMSNKQNTFFSAGTIFTVIVKCQWTKGGKQIRCMLWESDEATQVAERQALYKVQGKHQIAAGLCRCSLHALTCRKVDGVVLCRAPALNGCAVDLFKFHPEEEEKKCIYLVFSLHVASAWVTTDDKVQHN